MLELATADGPKRADALAPFASVASVDAPTEERLVEVARAALDAGGPGASAAASALGAAGRRAAPLLREVLLRASAPIADRTEAARRLGRLGLPGQNELRQALHELMPEQPIERPPRPSAWFPLLTVLTALHPPTPGVSAELDTLSHLAPPKGASSSIRNLVTELRCDAAALLAGTASLSERLVRCDPDDGDVGQLAIVNVLGRGELTAKRGARWRRFATSERPRVATRALSLLASHPEAPDAPEILAAALGRSEPGVVATAAQLILDHPSLVTERDPDAPDEEPGRPSPKVMAALTAALDRDRPPDQIHTRGMLLRAAARLGALSVKAKAEADCRVNNPTARRHAELALTMLAGTGARCPEPSRGGAPELASPGSEPIHLTFVTEGQRLGMTLEPSLAPESTARLVALARGGFFDGMPVHRVVPGRVVQLGDRTGVGYGGAGEPPLPSETSPVPFLPLSVGMALSGRDTASSQIFVTLTSQPELDGDYPLVGYADLEWNDVVEGDVIRSVVVKD
jgi:cyclophilin family peptidyl-prolyl cis-trans isomerase